MDDKGANITGATLGVNMMVLTLVSLRRCHAWCHYDGVTLVVTMMVTLGVAIVMSPFVLLWWLYPWCHYNGVTLGFTMMVTPLLSLW